MPADRCHYCLHPRSYHLDNESGLAGECHYIFKAGVNWEHRCGCVGYLDSTLPDTIEEKSGER